MYQVLCLLLTKIFSCMKTLESLSIFVGFDVLLIIVITIIYLVYKALKKDLTVNYITFSLVFVSLYMLFFYAFPFRQESDHQKLFFVFLLPVFTLVHWLVPFKKSKTLHKVVAIGSAVEFGSLLFLYVFHSLSDM